MKLKKYITHPKYNAGRFDYDFSLLELEETLQFGDKIQPVALPQDDLEILDDTMVEISGWGKDTDRIF